jgi:hypothetical protein
MAPRGASLLERVSASSLLAFRLLDDRLFETDESPRVSCHVRLLEHHTRVLLVIPPERNVVTKRR